MHSVIIKEFVWGKTILTALCMVAVATAQAQINIGKMASAATKGVQALSFSNEDAQKLILSDLTVSSANTKTKTV